MNSSISTFLQERIDSKDFPSAVYLVAEKGEIVMHEALGYAVVEPERIEAKIDTIYDLASLTKVLVTGLLAAKLIEKREVSLSDNVSPYLAEFEKSKAMVSIGDIAGHRSGFDGWVPFYLLDGAPEAHSHNYMGVADPVIKEFVLSQIATRPFGHEFRTKVVYSDLNFISLGSIVEAVHGSDLNGVFLTEIGDKLGLTRTFFGGADRLRREIAASEKGNGFEKQTAINQGYLIDASDPRSNRFRTETIWGEVHDNNAYYLHGVAGHAGLFSTAEEVFKIAQQFLPNYTTLLMPETCELFRTNFTPGMNEHRSFAFQLASTPDSTAGTEMSPQSFGHLGFTGTSLWIDPVKERVFILLTNRTHDRELPFENINSVRRRFHDLAIECLDQNS